VHLIIIIIIINNNNNKNIRPPLLKAANHLLAAPQLWQLPRGPFHRSICTAR
jgi:hypothetical protein